MSELKLSLGKVSEAIADSERSVYYADRDQDTYRGMSMRILTRTALADALHQAGERDAAETRFQEAERMNIERGSPYPLLQSVQGFQFCDLLLANSERTAWQYTLASSNKPFDCQVLHLVFQRAGQTLTWARNVGSSFLDIALDQLTLCRSALYHKLLSDTVHMGNIDDSAAFDSAVRWLRDSNYQDELPKGLLSRAWYRFVDSDPNGAQEDLDEAWEIAERGPMRLHMADIHLYRARLFFRESAYPWGSAKADLEAAEKLINECGYHRRDEELADAKLAILGI